MRVWLSIILWAVFATGQAEALDPLNFTTNFSSGFQFAEMQATSEPETWALFSGGILLGLFWSRIRIGTSRRR
jgi:hypothetical protein